MYCQVLFVDPVSEEIVEEFGWLTESNAEKFCRKFNKFAETSKTELRVAVIGEIAETFP